MEFLRRQAPRAAALVLTIRIHAPQLRTQSDLPGTRQKRKDFCPRRIWASMTCAAAGLLSPQQNQSAPFMIFKSTKKYRARGFCRRCWRYIPCKFNLKSIGCFDDRDPSPPHYVMQWKFNVQRQLICRIPPDGPAMSVSRGIHLLMPETTAI